VYAVEAGVRSGDSVLELRGEQWRAVLHGTGGLGRVLVGMHHRDARSGAAREKNRMVESALSSVAEVRADDDPVRSLHAPQHKASNELATAEYPQTTRESSVKLP